MINQDDSAALQTLIEADGGDLVIKDQTFRIGAPIDVSKVPEGRHVRFIRSRLVAVDDNEPCIFDFRGVNRPGGRIVHLSVTDCDLQRNGRPMTFGA